MTLRFMKKKKIFQQQENIVKSSHRLIRLNSKVISARHKTVII